jgi:hypothetical protein
MGVVAPAILSEFSGIHFNLRAALRTKREKKHVATPASTLHQKAVLAPHLPRQPSPEAKLTVVRHRFRNDSANEHP